MSAPERGRWLLIVLLSVPMTACTTALSARPETGLSAVPELRLGRPAADSLRNVNGSARIASTAAYERMLDRIAPALEAAHDDPRLGLDPNFVAAMLVKESGGDTLAVSRAPALGVAQLTVVADSELRRLTTGPRPSWTKFAWMGAEVASWPRDPRVHALDVSAARIDSMLAARTIDSRTEYLFDPALSARASTFYLRLLVAAWTDDGVPNSYASEARARIASGRPLTAQDIAALVVITYNQGPNWVLERVRKDGADWVARLDDGSHAGAEAADYLERVRTYAASFRRARTSMRTSTTSTIGMCTSQAIHR